MHNFKIFKRSFHATKVIDLTARKKPHAYFDRSTDTELVMAIGLS